MKITEQWCKDTLGAVAPAGPLPKDYTAVELACHWVYHNIENPQQWFASVVISPHRRYVDQRDKGRGYSRAFLAQAFEQQHYDLLLHVWNKPRGYNGDGDLLQKMYDCLSIPDTPLFGLPNAKYVKSLWDHYISARPEMLALQGRREIFESMLPVFIASGARSFLDLGCGNGSYMQHAYNVLSSTHPNPRVIGVDFDAQPEVKGPTFEKMNVIKSLPEGQFDVVYSGGLFDYFNDKLFRHMLDRIMTLKPMYIMIGNIDQSPTTKSFMGCCSWELFDRSRWNLVELTMNKFGASQVSVISDITGHQHFLVIKIGDLS